MFSVEVPPWGLRSSALLRVAKGSYFVHGSVVFAR